MTAEPLHDVGYDPAEISRVLPEKWREQFLREYHSAVDAAHDVWRYKQLQDLLHLWRLRALAFSNPDFERAKQDVHKGRRAAFVAMDEAFPGWADRR